jgi:hypothetical protein
MRRQNPRLTVALAFNHTTTSSISELSKRKNESGDHRSRDGSPREMSFTIPDEKAVRGRMLFLGDQACGSKER